MPFMCKRTSEDVRLQCDRSRESRYFTRMPGFAPLSGSST